jgi:methylmalonyl-CoA mutase
VLRLADQRAVRQDPAAAKLLAQWPEMQKAYAGDEYVVKIRDKEIRTALTTPRCQGSKIRKVALPGYECHGELLKWLMLDNVPGSFPYTAGTFAFKREGEDPTRMFAGEGDAFRTNRRFKLVSEGMPAKRLSTAFDSVTLYGNDPDRRPDIYGKVGNSGVSIATLDDLKVLYDGLRPVPPGHQRQHDDQRPGAQHPGDVHEHGHRPADREVHHRQRARAHRHRGGQDP